MGKGVISARGLDPLKEWSSRIGYYRPPELGAALRALLAGEPVVSEDGGLEISVRAKPSGRWVISIRLPDAPQVADIEVAPIPGRGGPGRDPRSAIPCPARWKSPGQSPINWELFNCVVYSLTPRDQ